ncbi:hypothetical protein [Xanthomonas hortorum]|uniref:hypothetical protein n=1 Tax=Xanthomonas hortorum TaxID=56454 RepID=UPI0032E8D428
MTASTLTHTTAVDRDQARVNEASQRSRMNMLHARVFQLLIEASARSSEPGSVTLSSGEVPIARNASAGSDYFLVGDDRELVCAPSVEADLHAVQVCADVPYGGLGWQDLKVVNDGLEAWLAAPAVSAMTPAEVDNLRQLEETWVETLSMSSSSLGP